MQRSAPRPVGSDRRFAGAVPCWCREFVAGSASMKEAGWGLGGADLWGNGGGGRTMEVDGVHASWSETSSIAEDRVG